jgi:hypothetical protein
MSYVDSTERVGDYILQVIADDDPMSPREWDNLSHIYGQHRNYTIGDGEPPSDHLRALQRGGPRLLYRWLRRYQGLVAFTKLGMYEHSGITVYPVPLGSNGHHAFDSDGWDSGTVGYAYVDRERLDYMGTDQADAERVMLAEVQEYDNFVRGDVWGFVLSKPCDHEDEHDSDESIAACPHSEIVESVWGFIGDPKYAHDEGMAEARAMEGVTA